MSRLLVTTFQRDGINLHEAQRFKAGALASKLILLDRTNELGRVPEVLREIPARQQRGVLEAGSTDSDRLYGLMQLSMSGGAGWSRVSRLKAFEDWLASLYAEDVTCWVVGGHHHTGSGGYASMVWGTDPPKTPSYRPYTGFGVQGGQLSWFGFRGEEPTPRRIALPSAAAKLKSVALMTVIGCNGIPHADDPRTIEMAKGWRSITKPALILGWWGVHSMPKDANFEGATLHASTRFWKALADLKIAKGIGDGKLDLLVQDHAPAVIEAWGHACWETFKSGPQRDLWRLAGVGGAGAVFPGKNAAGSGVVYHANPAYAGTSAAPAMLATTLVIP